MVRIFIQKVIMMKWSREAAALIHPGFQGSSGDLVFLTATEKKSCKSVTPSQHKFYILNASSLYLHDMYHNTHARHRIPVHCIQHRLGDRLKQVLWFLDVQTHLSGTVMNFKLKKLWPMTETFIELMNNMTQTRSHSTSGR